MATLIEVVREQKGKISTAQNDMRIAEAEISRLQRTCQHLWRYESHNIVSRTDSDFLHRWILHVKCDACEAEQNRYLFAPPCPMHLQAMEHDKIVEHLRPQEGQRNR